jgi:low temperature requirement protein LtrA
VPPLGAGGRRKEAVEENRAGARLGPGVTRARLHAPDPQPVTFVELFFDLVFVFAVTQLTALTAGDLTAAGVVRSLVLFWLVWWSWTQFTWTLNPADTGHTLVRACTLLATAVAFVMAASVTDAYGADPLWFVVPYLVVRLLGLALQVRVDLERGDIDDRNGVWRWAGASTVVLLVVLAGGFLGVEGRTWLWALAVCGDLAATSFAGRGYLWDLHAAHFAERHGLFVIIALGESLIVAGTAVASDERTPELIAAAGAALIVACLLWWTYFGWLKEALQDGLRATPAQDVGRVARDAFSLAHFALVCGIVGFAVAVEEIVAHPDEGLHSEVTLALGSGVALFVGFSAFALWRARGILLVPRLALLVATLVGVAVVPDSSPVWPLAALALGLLVVIVSEELRRPATDAGGEVGIDDLSRDPGVDAAAPGRGGAPAGQP